MDYLFVHVCPHNAADNRRSFAAVSLLWRVLGPVLIIDIQYIYVFMHPLHQRKLHYYLLRMGDYHLK